MQTAQGTYLAKKNPSKHPTNNSFSYIVVGTQSEPKAKIESWSKQREDPL